MVGTEMRTTPVWRVLSKPVSDLLHREFASAQMHGVCCIDKQFRFASTCKVSVSGEGASGSMTYADPCHDAY